MKWLVASVLPLLLVMGSACSDEGDDRPATETPTAEDAPTETPSTGGVVAPPPASLVDESGTARQGGTGTYCWRLGSDGVCIDLFGPRTNVTPITITAGSQLEFEFEAGTPTELVVDWTPLSEMESSPGEGNTLDWGPKDPSNFSGPDYVADLTAPTEPGRYVLVAFTRFAEGDVTYGFYVEVR